MGLSAEIDAAVNYAAGRMSELKGILNFNVSPTVTPKFGPMPSASPTGLKTGSADMIKQKQHAMFADYGVDTA